MVSGRYHSLPAYFCVSLLHIFSGSLSLSFRPTLTVERRGQAGEEEENPELLWGGECRGACSATTCSCSCACSPPPPASCSVPPPTFSLDPSCLVEEPRLLVRGSAAAAPMQEHRCTIPSVTAE